VLCIPILQGRALQCTLQRTNTKNWKQIFPEKKLRGHSPNLQIHVSVSDLYIPTVDLPMEVRTTPCFLWRHRQLVLQVMEYLTHAACLSTSARVHFVYRPFTYHKRLSCSVGQRKKKTEGVAESNIQTRGGLSTTTVFTPPFSLFAPYAPQWLTAIGVCPFSLVPDYLL
jgi:hypothetical protein